MVKMSKAQGSIALIFFIIFMIAVIFFAIFILKSVKDVEEDAKGISNPNLNISGEEFGEPTKGSTMEEKKEKIKDSNIAPPELGG